MAEAASRDSDFMTEGALASWADTGNPHYVWFAIKICTEHKKPLPEWILAYLADCADRMLSDEARAGGHDLRKMLPWIFGFPSKRGPGNLLDPDREEPKGALNFALRFATHIELGKSPTAAMREACNDAFKGENVDADEKTLRRWLLKQFDLKKWPASAELWKKITREHLYRYLIRIARCGTESRETLTCHRACLLPALR